MFILSAVVVVGAIALFVSSLKPKSIETVDIDRTAAARASQAGASSGAAARTVHAEPVISPFYGEHEVTFPPKPRIGTNPEQTPVSRQLPGHAEPNTREMPANLVKLPPSYLPSKISISRHVAQQVGYDGPNTWEIKLPQLTRGEVIEIRQKIVRGEPLMNMQRMPLKSPLKKQDDMN